MAWGSYHSLASSNILSSDNYTCVFVLLHKSSQNTANTVSTQQGGVTANREIKHLIAGRLHVIFIVVSALTQLDILSRTPTVWCVYSNMKPKQGKSGSEVNYSQYTRQRCSLLPLLFNFPLTLQMIQLTREMAKRFLQGNLSCIPHIDVEKKTRKVWWPDNIFVVLFEQNM